MPRNLVSIALLLAALLPPAHAANPRAPGDQQASRGIAAFNRFDWETAIEAFTLALALEQRAHPRDHIHVLLGDAYRQVGDDRAAREYQTALRLNPGNCNAFVGLGILARQRGSLDEAEKNYRRALAVDQDCEEAYSSLGTLAIFRGDGESALGHFERAIALDPQFASAHGNRALALAMVGRIPEARAALKRAAALGFGHVEEIRRRIDALESAQ